MHRLTLALAVTAAFMISGPAYAQHGHGGGKPATSPPTSHGSSTASSTHGTGGAATHGKSTSTTHGNSGSHPTTTTANPHASSATHEKSGDTHGASTKPASTTNTTTLTGVQQKLQKNTNLADKLRTRLPEGADLMKSADGFKELGQFVAAVNVSANHEGVTFTELKTRMVDEGMSLGQALQDVKKLSNTTAGTEARRAEAEANEMIKSTTASNSTATTTGTKSKKTAKTKTGSTDDK